MTGPEVKITVLLFSHLRHALGSGKLTITLAIGSTAADLVGHIREMLEERLAGMPMRVAVNGQFATDDTILQAGDEVALIPPVQGG